MSSKQEKVMHVLKSPRITVKNVFLNVHSLWRQTLTKQQLMGTIIHKIKGKCVKRSKRMWIYLLFGKIWRFICPSDHVESVSGQCCSSKPDGETLVRSHWRATGGSMLQSLRPNTSTAGVFPAPGWAALSCSPLCYFQRQADLVPAPREPSTVKTEGAKLLLGQQRNSQPVDWMMLWCTLYTDWPNTCFSVSNSDRLLYSWMDYETVGHRHLTGPYLHRSKTLRLEETQTDSVFPSTNFSIVISLWFCASF